MQKLPATNQSKRNGEDDKKKRKESQGSFLIGGFFQAIERQRKRFINHRTKSIKVA
jgi:hypothetical protein